MSAGRRYTARRVGAATAFSLRADGYVEFDGSVAAAKRWAEAEWDEDGQPAWVVDLDTGIVLATFGPTEFAEGDAIDVEGGR